MSTSTKTPEPQYFKQNQALLPAGPARIAEVAAAKKRHLAYQKAVSASREMKDAVMVGQPMDKTGNFDGALDHALQVLDRLNEAMAEYRIQGITFLAQFDTEDAA